MTRNRYKELRNKVFTVENISRYYLDYANDLTRCGAARRDSLRWSGDSDLSGAHINVWYDSKHLKEWIDKRPVCLYEQPQQHKTAQDGQQIRGLIK
jgi:hypothetical protein